MHNGETFPPNATEPGMALPDTIGAAPTDQSRDPMQPSEQARPLTELVHRDIKPSDPQPPEQALSPSHGQSMISQATELAIPLPKHHTAALTIAGELRQLDAERSEVGVDPAAIQSDTGTTTSYAELADSGSATPVDSPAREELPAGQHESLSRLATDWPKDPKERGDSVGLEGVAPAQPTGRPADATSMMRKRPAGQDSGAEQTNGKPSRRWVWWLVVGVAVLGLVIGPIGIWLALVWFSGLAQLKSAMAEADAIYPHWRWEDLIRQREQVPPDQNGWPLIEQIAARYRANPHTPIWEGTPLEERRAQPNQRSHNQLQVVQELVNADPQLVALFASLSTYDKAQPPIPSLAANPWETPLPHREVLLAFWGCLPALHDYFIVTGRLVEVDWLLRTGWKIVASADEDPFIEGQETGMFLEDLVLAELEQRLALGEMSLRLLKEMQQILDRRLVINHQRALWMVRGDRALTHELFTNIHRGSLTWQQLLGVPNGPTRGFDGSWLKTAKEWLHYRYFLWNLTIKGPRIHSLALRYWNRLELAARTSEEELNRELHRTTRPGLSLDDESWWLAYYTFNRFDHSLHAVSRWLLLGRQRLEVARAALAAEELRIEHGRFPTDWNELVPQYLPSVPHDSCASGPLQLKTTADGIVIYSIGEDRRDDGGDPRHDVAFRVYHRDKRGLPPVPLKPSAYP